MVEVLLVSPLVFLGCNLAFLLAIFPSLLAKSPRLVIADYDYRLISGEILHPKEGEASARGDGAGGSQEDPAVKSPKQPFQCRHIQKHDDKP